MLKKPSALKSRNQLQQSQARSIKPASVKKDMNMISTIEAPNFAQENQAIKWQKLEGGKTRQILNVKPQNLPHKTRAGLISSSSNLCLSSTAKTCKELYVRERAVPFVSMAEMMKKFQSNTREMSLPHRNSSLPHVTQWCCCRNTAKEAQAHIDKAQGTWVWNCSEGAHIK